MITIFIKKVFERPLKKWGNSLAITIDSNVVKTMNLKDSDMLRVTIEKLEYDLIKRIVDDIRLLRSQPHYQKLSDEEILKDMLSKAEGEIA